MNRTTVIRLLRKSSTWQFAFRCGFCKKIPTFKLQLYSYIFISTFALRCVAGAVALGGLEITHDFQQSLIVLLPPHQNGTKQGRGWNDATCPLPTSWPLPLGCSRHDMTFLWHSGHVVDHRSWHLSIRRSGSTFRALRISHLNTVIVAKG